MFRLKVVKLFLRSVMSVVLSLIYQSFLKRKILKGIKFVNLFQTINTVRSNSLRLKC